jgi:hypothetical protein
VIYLELISSHVDSDGRVVSKRVGTVHAEGDRVEIDPPEALSADLIVLSPRDGERLTVADGEDWARGLDGTLRGVGLMVNVLQDTDPVVETQDDDEEDFDLPTPARTAHGIGR